MRSCERLLKELRTGDVENSKTRRVEIFGNIKVKNAKKYT
jgi:hypothetical protein